MTTWLYLIVTPSDDAGPAVADAIPQTQHPAITSRIYSSHGDALAPQCPQVTAQTIAALREAGLRVSPGATLRIGVDGELAALWEMVAHGSDASAPSGHAAAEAWTQGAPRAPHVPLRLVGAAWEEVGINLSNLMQMARVLRAAQAKPPTTAEGLNALVTWATAAPPYGPDSSPPGEGRYD